MKPFFIVGVGASAGGLEAFTQLFETMPEETGLSFVLIQHLDPKHESALVSLLSRVTRLPVTEAAHNTKVRPNHIYVIPPNAEIVFSNGFLRLQRLSENRGVRRSIDNFFESVAQEQGERAIGVILSGTASDGTLGLEAIKAEGGITIAQDESAKYPSMPQSAVAAGCVDFVLPPKEIAHELVRIARLTDEKSLMKQGKGGKKTTKAAQAAEAARAASSDKIIFLLRNHTDVDFSLYKPATLRRRIARRMLLLKIKTMDAYVQRLRNDKNECDALYQDFLISVTGFFRNPDAFKALAAAVAGKLKDRSPEDPIRVWVAGCSSGQETYSIAMALLETLADKRVPIQIYATDLNETLLEKARAGLYPKSLLRDVPPEYLRKYFVEEKGVYRVAKSVRELCVFAKHNVIADPPFSRMDLISCRNMMIYIEPAAQKKIIPAFHYALKPDGLLFLGSSETTNGFNNLFAPLDRKHRIFAKLPAPARLQNMPIAVPAQRPRAAAAPQAPERGARELDISKEADRLALSRYVPPNVLINENMDVLQFRGDTAPYLRPPRGRATFNLLKMAGEGVMLALRSAVNQARKNNERVRKENVRVEQNGGRKVHIEVQPIKNVKERCYLVFFEPAERPAVMPPRPEGKAAARAPSAGESRELARLREELGETREYLQSFQEQYEVANEELQASNEEVQSSNEELQSINEELETSKEELESTNEELTTVNEEMSNRNNELTRLTGDLNNLHANVDTAILLLGRDLRIRRFTALAEKMFNLMGGDVDRPLSAVKMNFDLPDLESVITTVITTMATEEREVRDYNGRWYLLRVRPYMTIDNMIDGAVVTMVDVTALKKAVQKCEVIIDTAPPMLVLDSDLRVSQVNRSFCEAFQVTSAQTHGQLVYDLGNGQWNIPRLRILLRDILPRDKVVVNFEVEHDFDSLGRRTMLLNGREVDWGGAGRSILISFVDVTERKAALVRLQQYNAELEKRVHERTTALSASNQELEAFCYSVAHDLRNPLRGIEGFARVLGKEYAPKLDDKGKAYFDRIRAAVYRMSHLIDSLLDLSRLTRSEIRREEVDLSAMAREILGELKKKNGGRRVETVVAPDVAAVGDGRLLRIALTNLLENAWKFTAKHDKAYIEFGACAENGAAVFFVKDDGAGFDMAYADKLFQTFQRLHSPEEFPGTGIGLTLVQRIVQRHGGRIWAEGAPEKGATFYFSLTRPEPVK